MAREEVIKSRGTEQKGGDSHGMREKEDGKSALLRAAENGSLGRQLRKYLRSCRSNEESDSKKDGGRLPTLAGFCGMLGCGISAADELRRVYPSQFDYISAVLEDEALNSGRSSTIVNAYLKERLGYGEKGESGGESEPLQLVFAHDILEDGQ